MIKTSRASTDSTEQTITDDAALFRAAVGSVKPLPHHNRITPKLPKPPAFQSSTRPAKPDAPLVMLSDHAAENAPEEYLSNGLSRMTLRKLRRGFLPVQDKLDLHGSNSDVARQLLTGFLHEATQNSLRCVLVIHGKGMNSKDGEAILKLRARHWLTQHPQVLAYCDATPKDGGSGAVLVLLRTRIVEFA